VTMEEIVDVDPLQSWRLLDVNRCAPPAPQHAEKLDRRLEKAMVNELLIVGRSTWNPLSIPMQRLVDQMSHSYSDEGMEEWCHFQ